MNGQSRNKLECIVFDFDGTLAELRLDFADMKRKIHRLASTYLPPLSASPTLRALELVALYAKELEKTNFAAAVEFHQRGLALIRGIELNAALNGRLFPFTRALLEDLRRRNIKMGIITRNCEKAVRIVFPDIMEYCSVLLTREHVRRVKPHPDHLLQAIVCMKVHPSVTLMVGDHPLDVETGQRAGTLTAGVSSGNSSLGDLSRSGAKWVADNCQELMYQLKEQGHI